MSSKKTRKEHERKRREKLEARANIDALRELLAAVAEPPARRGRRDGCHLRCRTG